ncbi:uncharacterized protein LOC125383253 [Haliotis rufescens]|uniref:uncharacterized protein LOC125383253 n=1 Tax=Haliotis rufescens TaxID=6454 RepID=UPI00201F4FA1|nr:uncharacterized protein LOC125383253 [Haliotis rufescens]
MGATHRQISRTFNCSQTTISKLIIRYQQAGQTQDRPRSGRPRVTTPAEDRYIRQIHLRNRCVTATSAAATALGHAISRRTVLRRLRTAGTMAEFEFFDEGESDWRQTALEKFNCLEVEASWYGVVWGGMCGQITRRLAIIRGNLNAQR